MHMLLMFGKNLKLGTIKVQHGLYLKCDALLLAEAFEKFKNNSLKNYGLCPSDYLSAPGLSWEAMFKMKKIEFKLILDPDMYTGCPQKNFACF